MALVEHEITQTVEDGNGRQCVARLQDVGMVADNGVNARLYQLMGIVALLHVGNGLEFRSPVKNGHHEVGRMAGFVVPDMAGQPSDGSLTDIGLSFPSRPVFYGQRNGIEEGYIDVSFPDDGRCELFFQSFSVA